MLVRYAHNAQRIIGKYEKCAVDIRREESHFETSRTVMKKSIITGWSAHIVFMILR